MTNLYRHRVRWTALPGGTGISNFYFLSPGRNPDLRTLFVAIALYAPSAVRFKFDTSVAKIDSETGQLVGEDAGGAAVDVAGGSVAAYSAAAGGMIDWRTEDFVNGRQVRGRTFLVPLAGLENDGTLSSACVNAINAAALVFTLARIGDYVVYTRPKGTTPGSAHVVVTGTCQDKSFVLRSRRD